MFKIKNKLFIILTVGLVIFGATKLEALPITESSSTSSEPSPLTLHLYNGSYGDFDGDGEEDDLEVYLDIIINSDKVRKNFMVYLHVYVPNGDVYAHSFLCNTIHNDNTFLLHFIDHAYAPGDFTITAEINLFSQGVYYDETEITFDPPTEKTPDDEPYMTIS